MKITRSGECKNSPKNAFVEDFVIDFITSAEIRGRVEDSASLPSMPHDVSEVQIIHAISHGRVGAANGILSMGGSKQPFSVFMEFTSAKAMLVRSLNLYWQ